MRSLDGRFALAGCPLPKSSNAAKGGLLLWSRRGYEVKDKHRPSRPPTSSAKNTRDDDLAVVVPCFINLLAKSNQLAHRFPIIQDIHRPAAAVGERLGGVDAHGLVQRGEHLRHRVAVILGIFAA